MAAPLPPRLRRLIAAASRMYFSSPAEDNWWLNIATAGNTGYGPPRISMKQQSFDNHDSGQCS
jgi:hypothetical protein